MTVISTEPLPGEGPFGGAECGVPMPSLTDLAAIVKANDEAYWAKRAADSHKWMRSGMTQPSTVVMGPVPPTGWPDSHLLTPMIADIQSKSAKYKRIPTPETYQDLVDSVDFFHQFLLTFTDPEPNGDDNSTKDAPADGDGEYAECTVESGDIVLSADDGCITVESE